MEANFLPKSPSRAGEAAIKCILVPLFEMYRKEDRPKKAERLRMIEESKTLQKAKVEANRLRQITSQTLDDLGRLERGLHPNTLDDLGLVVALNRYASDYSRSFRI